MKPTSLGRVSQMDGSRKNEESHIIDSMTWKLDKSEVVVKAHHSCVNKKKSVETPEKSKCNTNPNSYIKHF